MNALDEVRDFLRPFNMGAGNEDEPDELLYTDRSSAGDDEPPDDLVAAFKSVAERVRARFPGIDVRVETMEEWVELRVTLKVAQS